MRRIAIVVLGLGLVVAGVTVSVIPVAPTTAQSGANVRPTIAAYQTQVAELHATIAALQTRVASETGRTPPPAPPPHYKPTDCVKAAQDTRNPNRFAFVPICETVLDQIAATMCTTNARYTRGFLGNAFRHGVKRTTAFQWLAQEPVFSGYAAIQAAYEKRLRAEWAKGNVPAGIPRQAPDLEQSGEVAGCVIDQKGNPIRTR